MEKVLNQEEIDAMVRAAREGPGSASASSHGPTVVPWDVRQAGQIGREQLRAISLLHEIFARNLSHGLAAYLRIVFEAALVSAEHLSFREYLQRIPEITYLCSCRLAPMDVTALMQLDLSIAFPLIDLLLGGEGRGTIKPREVTEIEEQILESIVQIILRELGVAWQALGLEFRFDRRQLPANAQRLMLPDEKTLSLSFEITMPETRGTLNLAIPAVVSNALLRKMSADWAYQKPRSRAECKDQVKSRLLGCPFGLDLAVTDVRIPAQDLAHLTPGSLLVLRRKVDTPATLLVGERPMFGAYVARRGSQRAAQLSERQRTQTSPGKESA
jgi:flagellar motor switch protein FliM